MRAWLPWRPIREVVPHNGNPKGPANGSTFAAGAFCATSFKVHCVGGRDRCQLGSPQSGWRLSMRPS